MFTGLFFKVIGIGIAVPCFIVILANLIYKAKLGKEYDLQIFPLSIVYILFLLGVGMIVGTK